MLNERLRQLKSNLALLREQLAGLEKAKTLSPLEEKVRLGQRIKGLRQEIRPIELEYAMCNSLFHCETRSAKDSGLG